MKKLQQLQNEFKSEIRKNKNYFFEKNFNVNNHIIKQNDSFSKLNVKTNQLIRNSSIGNFTLKRDNSLKSMLNKSEIRNNYLHRNNSKIFKTIENIKTQILDDNKSSIKNPKTYISNFLNNKENSFLNSNMNLTGNSFLNKINLEKKNYFGKTSNLLNELNPKLNKEKSFENNSLYNYSKIIDRKSFSNIDDY